MFPAITILIIVNMVATLIILKIFGNKITNYLSDTHEKQVLKKIEKYAIENLIK